MGTRGHYVFRYKNKWYVFYNHWDSYPSGLGQDIVNELKGIDWEEVKRLLEKITTEDINDGYNFKGLMETLKNPKDYILEFIEEKYVGLRNDIEYVYTIDIDENMFHVEYYTEKAQNIQRFRLNAIPDDWKDFIIT